MIKVWKCCVRAGYVCNRSLFLWFRLSRLRLTTEVGDVFEGEVMLGGGEAMTRKKSADVIEKH